jgi:hypothetical protein
MTAYQPLHEMTTTGAARLSADGALIESGEYVAALYESYAADHEYVDTFDAYKAYARHVTEYDITHAAGYANTAQTLAEDLWTRDLHEVIDEYSN